MTKKVTLEYIGPAGSQMFDEEDRNKAIELVAGRRYQMSEALAAYRLEHDSGHWKRPDPPKASAAVKE
jgi:hypothetical protein